MAMIEEEKEYRFLLRQRTAPPRPIQEEGWERKLRRLQDIAGFNLREGWRRAKR